MQLFKLIAKKQVITKRKNSRRGWGGGGWVGRAPRPLNLPLDYYCSS